MFADVMVRVIGVSYFTSVPSTVSEPEDSNP
ncbi:superoxide dismutase, partial [Shigella flexneri]|nr:superoxide dismutase [Shigella flexneri]EFV9357690.1 superoxide dismutase [Shigella flexneri]EFW0818256.1 superoxide dismutase [Shigella flexneri]EFW1041029.1 superoxide dismutase [Shigella flexneri]EFW1057390.1 superoxide dismutase [Shigella flexneri]